MLVNFYLSKTNHCDVGTDCLRDHGVQPIHVDFLPLLNDDEIGGVYKNFMEHDHRRSEKTVKLYWTSTQTDWMTSLVELRLKPCLQCCNTKPTRLLAEP